MSRDSVIETGGALVIGAGLAGLFTALRLAPLPVTVLSPVALGDGASSAWAQGGVAAALAPDDSPELHARDTVAAGAGTVDIEVAASVADEAAARIADLAALGVPFDRGPDGAYVQSREAAHSAHRVIRVRGDTAGAAIMGAIIARVRMTASIRVIEGITVDDLALIDGRVVGAFGRRSSDRWSTPMLFRAPATVLATGGVGGLFAVTSNPEGVRGQGLGMAARAGATVQDPEFVQFHPTGLAVSRYPTPLASEALRGEGALLVDETGRRFMTDLHPLAELAPRDVVARGIHRHLAAGHRVFLDTRSTIGAHIDTQFPTIAGACRAAGIDPVAEPIPVRPLQHYHMGGVQTDRSGRSTLAGLWACGEVACTGLHGANRLASNSLLEALVYGARVARSILGETPGNGEGQREVPHGLPPADLLPAPALARLRETMSADVGVERDAAGLTRALGIIARLETETAGTSRAMLNMLTTATLIAAAALRRQESRGGHARLDFPDTDPVQAHPTRITLAEALEIRAAAAQETA